MHNEITYHLNYCVKEACSHGVGRHGGTTSKSDSHVNSACMKTKFHCTRNQGCNICHNGICYIICYITSLSLTTGDSHITCGVWNCKNNFIRSQSQIHQITISLFTIGGSCLWNQKPVNKPLWNLTLHLMTAVFFLYLSSFLAQP